MTPGQELAADGLRGIVVGAGLLATLALGVLIAPKLFPRFTVWPHYRTLAFAWAWLGVAWAFNGSSIYFAGKESFGPSWTCYWLSAVCRVALGLVVVWRMVSVASKGATPRTTR